MAKSTTKTKTREKHAASSSTRKKQEQKAKRKRQKSVPQSVSLAPDNVVFLFRNLFHFLNGFLIMSIFFFLVLLFMLLVESSFGISLLHHVFLDLLFIFVLVSIGIFLVPEIMLMHRVNNRYYSLRHDRLVFSLGLFSKREEFIGIDDIERLEIEKKTFTDVLFDTSTIVIRTRISYYDPIIIPCVREANKKYIEMEKIISSYKFK